MLLNGLINENEFYSDHYLSEIFAGDIKDTLNTWQQQEQTERDQARNRGEAASQYKGYRTPPNQLAGMANEYLQRLGDAERQRTPAARQEAARQLLQRLCKVFGLPCEPRTWPLAEQPGAPQDAPPIPWVGGLSDTQGKPVLWILEALPHSQQDADTDPLAMLPDTSLRAETGEAELAAAQREQAADWQKRLSQDIFSLEHPPRWVILASPRQWILLDRTKFAQHRLLRFDWADLFSRRETDSLKAVSVMLHRDSLLDSQGTSLLDTLDEKAHKHAYGVSEDLKYALRECIELLGDEAARQLDERARRHNKSIYTQGTDYSLDAGELSLECLRYMYRLLFLFYIEARPELGYAPVDSATYLKGYSLEHLRELEMVPLTSDAERQGHYFHHTLTDLFRLVYQGFDPAQTHQGDLGLEPEQTGRDAFTMPPLQSHLFDPSRTSSLNKVAFPNHLLQRVIQLMSLSRPAKGNKRRGRISYAQLGINQLGAVYEALLSYRGFFARENLYEVKPKGEKWDPLGTGYFVNADALNDYSDDEKVYTRDEANRQALRRYPRGSFIYRLAGRDRQKSASYYTPEVLTRSLVKYALKEVWKEQLDPLPDDASRARRVLELTVCEPAMGSAAFLNEAINQMADKYLALVQSARAEDPASDGSPARIPQSEYAAEKQRVKMYLADHNVFGVDLNPVAVELAEVSLWLNALSNDRFVPWFGLQLYNGNSLIGARREVFHRPQLTTKGDSGWLKTPPQRLPLGQERQPGQVWHFLVPDAGMAHYNDKDIKQLYPEQVKTLNQWRKQVSQPFSKDELERLDTLSAGIDRLWQQHVDILQKLRRRNTDPYSILGQPAEGGGTTLNDKDQALRQTLLAQSANHTPAYQRLKLVMDY